jgi:hypothetical protein
MLMIHSLIKLYLKKIYFFIKDLIDLGIIISRKKNEAEKLKILKKILNPTVTSYYN